MGAHTVILRHNPDHEDLLTATDSEVLCRLVGRWVGQGGKASLVNTADADILEYILVKLAARIAAKARTFLVKVKSHRGEPLNEGADDLAEAGRSLAKEGEGYRWKQRTTRLVFCTMTGSRTNGKKAPGSGLFETQQGEDRWNLC